MMQALGQIASTRVKVRTACVCAAVALVVSNEACGLHMVADGALNPTLRTDATLWLFSDVCLIDKVMLFPGVRLGDVLELRCGCCCVRSRAL